MSNWHKPAPAILQQLVANYVHIDAGDPDFPVIIDWAEHDTRYVAVLEDGRKLIFTKETDKPRRDQKPSEFKGRQGK